MAAGDTLNDDLDGCSYYLEISEMVLERGGLVRDGRLAVALCRGVVVTALLRLAGKTAGIVTCEGMLPVLMLGGTVNVGRLAIRAMTARVELGAVKGASLQIGDRVFINQGASVVAHSRIEIGDDVRLGDFVAIYDSNQHPVSPNDAVVRAPVRIGRSAWLGRGVTVLPGSVIGEYAVVGAGSLVRGEIPPRCVAVGNPAKVVRQLDVPAGWQRP